MTPVVAKPAASVILVRSGLEEPIEVYMIRRDRRMRFLGGYYAFPGGKVEAEDASPESFARCRGLHPSDAEELFALRDGVPALAYWVTAARELLEESGVLFACDESGSAIDAGEGSVAEAIERCRSTLDGGGGLAKALASEGWFWDLRPFRYLSHFITPTSSPIRFSARFFLCPLPARQAPRLLTSETSEGLWIAPAEGHARFLSGVMAMAEPAEYALAYLAQFGSVEELFDAHDDGRQKFQGIIERLDFSSGRFEERTGSSRP